MVSISQEQELRCHVEWNQRRVPDGWNAWILGGTIFLLGNASRQDLEQEKGFQKYYGYRCSDSAGLESILYVRWRFRGCLLTTTDAMSGLATRRMIMTGLKAGFGYGILQDGMALLNKRLEERPNISQSQTTSPSKT